MFDLTITFTGLCMLVRDPANNMLHVLMPFPGAHPHFARLIFVDQAGQVRKEEIAGMDLELPGVTGSNGFSPDVHGEVFDFADPLLVSRTVPRNLLDTSPPPNPPVRTRMRITAGKTGVPRRRGGWWNFNLTTIESRRLPTALDWLINDVNLTHLVVRNTAGADTFDIFPRNGRIHLIVAHVTGPERDAIGPDIPDHSNCPPDKKAGDHFGLYGGLLNPPGIATPPLFDRPKSHAFGLCATPFAAARAASLMRDQAAAVAAGAAAAATAAAVATVAPGAAATSAAAAAEAAAAATAAVTAAAAAAAAGGSELTCMITTAPAG
ncbi:MAG TPA: hypothetical protein VF006_24035 [Longimicrobium sp.]